MPYDMMQDEDIQKLMQQKQAYDDKQKELLLGGGILDAASGVNSQYDLLYKTKPVDAGGQYFRDKMSVEKDPFEERKRIQDLLSKKQDLEKGAYGLRKLDPTTAEGQGALSFAKQLAQENGQELPEGILPEMAGDVAGYYGKRKSAQEEFDRAEAKDQRSQERQMELLDKKSKYDAMAQDAKFSAEDRSLAKKLAMQAAYDIKKIQAENEGKLAVATATGKKEKMLPAGQVETMSGATASIQMIDDLGNLFKANESELGPVKGRLGALNPYNTTVQSLDAASMSAIQKIGTYLEGGKLTDKDIPKYQRMLPTATDTPQVRENKLNLVKKLVADKATSDRRSFQQAGYNIGELPEAEAVGLPAAMLQKKSSKQMPGVQASIPGGSSPAPIDMTEKHKAAIAWADSQLAVNPNDEKAKAVKAKAQSALGGGIR